VGFAVVDAFIDLVLRSDKASKYGEENMATIPKDFRRVIVAASVGNVIEV
jgi:FMN-dependent NADH-azoreductase